MTNRTWYLIKASAQIKHPFKQSNGKPLIVNEGEWFTSEVPEHVLLGLRDKSKKDLQLEETKNAMKPTMEQCLLDGYGTHCDIWPAYKDDGGFYKTKVVLDSKTLEKYEFVSPIDEEEYENASTGIGIIGARVNGDDGVKDIHSKNLVEVVSASKAEIVLKFEHRATDPESVVGFNFYLKPKGETNAWLWRLVIDPVIRNNGGDPGGDGG